MFHCIYKDQVLNTSNGVRWRVVDYSVGDDYVALLSLTSPRAAEVRALTSLLRCMQSGTVREVATVNRSGPMRDVLWMPFPLPKASKADVAASVRVNKRECKRASSEELRTCLSRFVQRRAIERAQKG